MARFAKACEAIGESLAYAANLHQLADSGERDSVAEGTSALVVSYARRLNTAVSKATRLLNEVGRDLVGYADPSSPIGGEYAASYHQHALWIAQKEVLFLHMTLDMEHFDAELVGANWERVSKGLCEYPLPVDSEWLSTMVEAESVWAERKYAERKYHEKMATRSGKEEQEEGKTPEGRTADDRVGLGLIDRWKFRAQYYVTEIKRWREAQQRETTREESFSEDVETFLLQVLLDRARSAQGLPSLPTEARTGTPPIDPDRVEEALSEFKAKLDKAHEQRELRREQRATEYAEFKRDGRWLMSWAESDCGLACKSLDDFRVAICAWLYLSNCPVSEEFFVPPEGWDPFEEEPEGESRGDQARASLGTQDELTGMLDKALEILDRARDQIFARRPELRASQPAIDQVGAESPKGVSLYDVAFLIEEDDKAATDLVKRWSDSKKISAESIGKCPMDGRRSLYRLSEILSDLKKIHSFDSSEMSKYRQRLADKLRAPRTE